MSLGSSLSDFSLTTGHQYYGAGSRASTTGISASLGGTVSKLVFMEVVRGGEEKGAGEEDQTQGALCANPLPTFTYTLFGVDGVVGGKSRSRGDKLLPR